MKSAVDKEMRHEARNRRMCSHRRQPTVRFDAAVQLIRQVTERCKIAVEHDEPAVRPQQAPRFREYRGGIRDMAQERMHDDDIKAFRRQTGFLRFTSLDVNPPCHAFFLRQSPPYINQIDADIDCGDRTHGSGVLRKRAGDDSGSASKIAD
jgi:hypothetical protein